MRTAFESWLTALDHTVLDLNRQVARSVRHAVAASLQDDLRQAETAIESQAEISSAARYVSDQVAALMARQQPVAQDLRRLLAAQRNASSLDHMGVLAASAAKLTRRRYPRTVVPPEVRGVVGDMAELSDRLLVLVGEILHTKHVAYPSLSLELTEHMEQLHREMMSIVRSPAWPHDVATAVDMSMLSRDLLRLTDHAGEITAAVQYYETGSTAPKHV